MPYLRSIQAKRYGALHDRQAGPFAQGLNVVYGPNEAGKSTLVSLVRGVLFGWEGAHGVHNTYRPSDGDRAGALEWAAEPGDAGLAPQLQRDEDGVTGDLAVIDDVDRDTFDAIFLLKADELRTLGNSSDVTARLLTAGSGTMSSPASAFVEVEQRIAALTAPAGGNSGIALDDAAPTSVFQLEAQLEATRTRMREAAAQADLRIQEDREMRELQATRAHATARVEELNAEIEALVAQRAELGTVDARCERHERELARLSAERSELLATRSAGKEESCIDERLLAMDSAEERRLRDRLDEFDEERAKIDRAVDVAKENSATSSAAYEALCELDDEEVAERARLRNRPWQTLLSVLLPIAFVVAGVPVCVHGWHIHSLSITALGVGLVVTAVFLAAAAFVMLFRNPRGSEALDSRRQDAQWVMLQDKKKLEASLADRDALNERIDVLFERTGLAAADGSLRQARGLLDEARRARAGRAEDAQRMSSIELRIDAERNSLIELAQERARITAAIAADGVDGEHLDAVIREKSAQRDALVQAREDMGQRYGELSRGLELVRRDRSFDELKLEYQVVYARLREAKHELIELLLAKRMLDRSIAAWEGQSQPEVYDRASQLLALMTKGRWVRVSASASGSLVALDASGNERDPRHLSLGTCQQLYLALRVALLMTAQGIGARVPVLVDDVLVNFDSQRRAGAAGVLAELAKTRQVIVFTCHESTVAALRDADPLVTCVNL